VRSLETCNSRSVRSYGQYCPVARTAELFAVRWTPIIIRNLLGGCSTFGQLRAGAPGIPKALLADRLGTLARAGIITRRCDGSRRVTYVPTERGLALKPVCDAMGVWGCNGWNSPRRTSPLATSYALLAASSSQTGSPTRESSSVLTSLRREGPARYWLLLQRPRPEVCAHHPGGDEDLVQTSAETLARWHLRELTYAEALRSDLLTVSGRPAVARAWTSWVRPSPHSQSG
jgi:DNA-binding HxlR family transcriptional regulator